MTRYKLKCYFQGIDREKELFSKMSIGVSAANSGTEYYYLKLNEFNAGGNTPFGGGTNIEQTNPALCGTGRM